MQLWLMWVKWSVLNFDMHLGTKLKCLQLHNGIWAWSMSPSKYVWVAVRICKEYVARHLSKGYRLPKREENPFESGCSPKLDVSPVLGPEGASYYQSLIKIIRRMIEIGQRDINTKVSLSSSYSAMPRQGYLEAVLHVMGYLKLRHNSRLTFDCSYPDVDHSNFWDCHWTDFDEGAVEAIPPNAPLLRGNEVDLCMFIDSNHDGNKRTRKSRTRFIIFISWYFKK